MSLTSSNALYSKLLFSLLLAKVNHCSASEGRLKLSMSSFTTVLCCPVKGACSLFRNHYRHFFLSVVCCEQAIQLLCARIAGRIRETAWGELPFRYYRAPGGHGCVGCPKSLSSARMVAVKSARSAVAGYALVANAVRTRACNNDGCTVLNDICNDHWLH